MKTSDSQKMVFSTYHSDYPNAVEGLGLIVETLGIRFARVLYACSGEDLTPAIIWPKENVTFIDKHEPRILLLKEEGLKAIAADVETIQPFDEFDVIYAHNCPAKLHRCIDMLVKGGYVIGNNMYCLKNLVSEQCVLVGAARKEKDPEFPDHIYKMWFDENPSGFFEEVKTYEEFKNCELDLVTRNSFESIMKQSGLEKKAAFEMLKKDFSFYKKYGELYVFQKV